ncbi:M50 family metallopeptidase [Myxococcota bacterium]
MTARGQRARLFMLLAIVVTVLLYVVPYGELIGYPLLLLSTLAHEMGHGIAAILVGAEFESLKMYADASGVAMLRGTSGRLANGVVSAGGLVGPAVAAAVLFVVSARQKLARFALLGLAVFLVGACIFVVRNPFGWVFVGLVAAIALAIAVKASAQVAQAVSVFVGAQLALAVFSRGDYLFTDVAQTANGPQPSDVAHMADALFLPYWFWGGVCGLFSVLVLLGGMWMFWRATGPTGPTARERLRLDT